MNPLIRFFVRRYVFSIAIFLAVVFFGISAGTRLGIDLLPEFDVPIVSVNTGYAGAGSQEAAEQLSEPIEDAIATVPGVTDVSSFSGEGFSFVIAQFTYGVDVDQAAIDVKQRVDAIAEDLPDDAGRPVVQKFDPNDQPILSLAVSGAGRELIEVQRIAEDQIEPALQQVDGVADVSVVGPIDREVQVLVDPAELRSSGLGITQVARAIGAGSTSLPAGSLTVGGERILLSLRDRPETAEDVAEMGVDPARGLLVRDVARVRDTVAEPDAFTRLNGEPVVLLEVRKISGANAVSTARALKGRLDELELPGTIEATVVGDTSVFVENSVVDTLRETALAVLAGGAGRDAVRGPARFDVQRGPRHPHHPDRGRDPVRAAGLHVQHRHPARRHGGGRPRGRRLDRHRRERVALAPQGRQRDGGGVQGRGRGVGRRPERHPVPARRVPADRLPPGLIGQFFSEFGLSLAATIFVSYFEAMFFLTVRLAYLPDPLPPSWSSVGASLRRLPADVRWTLQRYRPRAGPQRRWSSTAAGAADGALGGASVAGTLGLSAGWTSAVLLGVAGLAAAALLPWALLVIGCRPARWPPPWARRCEPATRRPTAACAGFATATPPRCSGS